MRAFVAIDLPDPVIDTLVSVQESLPAGHAAAPDTLHLTLQFLGDQPDATIADIDAALQDVRAEAFNLTLSGLDTFGGKDPKILHAGICPCPALDALHRAVKSALRDARLTPERKRFRPHVTLARFRRRLTGADESRLAAWLTQHAGFRAGPFTVRDFTLYRSTLARGGAIHDTLAQYPLD